MISKTFKENQQSFQNLLSNLDLDWFCLSVKRKKVWLLGNIFEKFSWKNEVSQMHQGSSQEASQSFRTSKNMKNLHRDGSGSIRNDIGISSENHQKTSFWTTFWTYFFKFSHAGACGIPAGGLEGLSFIEQWLVEHISCLLIRVIRGQSGASPVSYTHLRAHET